MTTNINNRKGQTSNTTQRKRTNYLYSWRTNIRPSQQKRMKAKENRTRDDIYDNDRPMDIQVSFSFRDKGETERKKYPSEARKR